jgi:hypothetical protein
MPSVSANSLIQVGTPDQLANRLGNTLRTIAGVGTAQSGAASITPNSNCVSGTTAGGATAFVLSTGWQVGDSLVFFNTSATAALLYPQSGGAINGGSTNASISVAQNTGVELLKTSSTAWRAIASNAGTGTAFTDITVDGITGTDASLGITGLAAAQGGAVAIVGGASSTSGNAGGAVSMTGGAGGATGVGGAASLVAAAGGSTSGSGGNANVTAGAGTAGNASGGQVVLTPGAKNGSGKDGAVYSRGAALVAKQAAPAAKTVTAAITAAELVAGLITTTGATAPSVHQLPTGTLIDAELPGVATGDSFFFSIINTGTGASDDATITVNTDVTIVGSPTIGALTDATIIAGSGRFLARRSGANTWVVYRVA